MTEVPPPLRPSLTDRTDQTIARVLAGQSRGPRAMLAFMGPAVIASIAYMDPGNFATNIQAGAHYGGALLWVVLLANVMAMLFQALSARLGIVTGRNLAELIGLHWPRPLVYVLWAASEFGAMATDLAEFLGGAVGLSLLLHLPLLAGMAITAIATLLILRLDRGGYRPMELFIGGLVAVIGLCYAAELLIAHVNWPEMALGTVVPRLPDQEALTIAVGIIGATIMPHALYLHSGLTQARGRDTDPKACRRLLHYSNREVVIALTAAGVVNMAMVVMASAAFHAGHPEVAEIETAYHSLTPLLGHAAAAFFLVSLIASGVSSSVVGTMAGQLIMQGFVGFRIPMWLRRLITILPAFAVVLAGVDATRALVLSQVALSLILPIPMVALLIFTTRARLMGEFRLKSGMKALAILFTALVLALNVVLILQSLGVSIPFLPSAE